MKLQVIRTRQRRIKMFLTKTEKLTYLYRLVMSEVKDIDEKIELALEYLILTIPGFDSIDRDTKEELVSIVLESFEDYLEDA